MEAISYYAIQASSELAEERGTYSSYEGSLWSQGIFPLDSLAKLMPSAVTTTFRSTQSDASTGIAARSGQGAWHAQLQCHGDRAHRDHRQHHRRIQSIEPTYQNLYVKSNLSGEFTVVNPYLVSDLKGTGLWDQVMVNDLKYYDGSVQPIDRIPDDLKAIYATPLR